MSDTIDTHLLEELTDFLMDNDTDLNGLYKIITKIQASEDLVTGHKFGAILQVGHHYFNRNFEVALTFLLMSYYNFQRIEGLMLVIERFIEMDRIKIAYMFSCLCQLTESIDNIGCDDFTYKYKRHYLHAVLSMTMKNDVEAKEAVTLAMKFLSFDKPEHAEYVAMCRGILDTLESRQPKTI